MDRSHLRKYVLHMGIDLVKVRTPASRNQPTLAVTEEEADRIRNERQLAGFSSSGKVETPGLGDFYIIVLDPEARPNRLKLGFSDGLEGRMATYRTSNPDVRVLHKWPCKPSWEQAAIAVCANAPGTQHVSGEVYDVRSIEDTLNRGDQFFSLVLPAPPPMRTSE